MTKASEHPTLRVIADGLSELGGAVEYWDTLTRQAPTPRAAIELLRGRIDRTTREIQDTLEGFDSFDSLAFLRMNADMIALAGGERESALAGSVTALEVVAHVLLGMGLPRQPLTGDNPGQPSPDTLIRLGRSIVEDARTIAMIQGSLSGEPLAKLAGFFKGAELSVRGRQYQSVAEDLNTALFDSSGTASILAGILGFTLADVRTVREAAIGLLRKRFFGTRDRIGDLVQRNQRGIELTTDETKEIRDGTIMMVGECRRFGCVTADDVATTAGLSENTARSVLDYFAAGKSGMGAQEMIRQYCRGERIQPWGCIVDNGEYLLLDGFLGEDELRRDLERGLTGSTRWSAYDKKRATFSESLAVEALQVLLRGEEPRWRSQEYLVPAAEADISSLSQIADVGKVTTKVVESDALFVVDGVALCVEVKAGSITGRARSGDVQRLARDLQKTLQDANKQADRLAALIRANRGVWDRHSQWVDLSEVREIHSIVITLDDLGPLSLAMNVLVATGIIESTRVPWIVTLHDLMVMAKVFDHPAQFLCFLRRRCDRRLATMVSGVDELDLLMWFLNGHMYVEPDPHEIAVQLPTDRPVSRARQKRYDEQPPILVGNLTDPLDAWVYFSEGRSENEAPKPSRREADWIEDFLRVSELAKSPGWLRIGADMVGLSPDDQVKRGKAIRNQCKESGKRRAERSVTVRAVNNQGSWLLAAVIQTEDPQSSSEYLSAKKYQTKSDRSMLLLYKANGTLMQSLYDDRPWEQSHQRDVEVGALPLFSLEASLRPVPPSSKRPTKRLRRPRPKKR